MRGVYTATDLISATSAAKTVVYITAAATHVIEILSSSITNASNETNEQCEAAWQLIGTLGTPTATTITPSPHERGDQAAASVVKKNVTASEPTYTASTQIGHEGFSSLGGWYFDPVPEERPVIAPSASWGLRLLNSPTAFDLAFKVTFREIG